MWVGSVKITLITCYPLLQPDVLIKNEDDDDIERVKYFSKVGIKVYAALKSY